MKRNKKGFTIVELVIVIAIIAVLAAVLIPTFSNIITKAEESAALQQLTAAYMEALTQALLDNGVIDTNKTFTASGFEFTFTSGDGANAEITKFPPDFGYNNASIQNGKVVLGEAGSSVPEPVKLTINGYEVSLYLTNVTLNDAYDSETDGAIFLKPVEGYKIDSYCVKIIMDGVELNSNDYFVNSSWYGPYVNLHGQSEDEEGNVTGPTTVTVVAEPESEPDDFPVGEHKVSIYLTNATCGLSSGDIYIYPDDNFIIDLAHVNITIGGETKNAAELLKVNYGYYYLDDECITDNTTVNVVAQPKPTGPVEVATAEALASALAAGGEVKLMADGITIDAVNISGKNVQLDLNGHTLNVNGGITVGSSGIFSVTSSSESKGKIVSAKNIDLAFWAESLTVNNVILEFEPGHGISNGYDATITIKNSKIETENYHAVYSEGDTTIRDTEISNTNSNDSPKAAIKVVQAKLILEDAIVTSDYGCVSVDKGFSEEEYYTATITGGTYTCVDTFEGTAGSTVLYNVGYNTTLENVTINTTDSENSNVKITVIQLGNTYPGTVTVTNTTLNGEAYTYGQ